MYKFFKKRPVLSFIFLAFLISWIFGLAAAVTLGPAERAIGWQNRPFSLLLLKFGPSIAGLFLAWYLSGKDGFFNLLVRGIKWKVSWKIIVTVLILPAILMLIPMYLWLPENLSNIFSWSTALILIQTAGLKIFLGGGFGEEFGWRGFLQPELEKAISPLTASMVVGVVWTAWHLPLRLVGGDIGHPVVFSATLLGYSVILAWIYHASGGSVLWAAVFHGWVNALSNTLDSAFGNQLTDIEMQINSAYAILIVLTAVLLLIIYGHNLGRISNEHLAHT